MSGILERMKAHRVPQKAPEEPKPLSFANSNPWSALLRELYVGKGRGKKEGATTESLVDGQAPGCARVACRESRPYTAG